jgi:hypothetical protein
MGGHQVERAAMGGALSPHSLDLARLRMPL